MCITDFQVGRMLCPVSCKIRKTKNSHNKMHKKVYVNKKNGKNF